MENTSLIQQDMVSVLKSTKHQMFLVLQHKHLYQEMWLQMNPEFIFQVWVVYVLKMTLLLMKLVAKSFNKFLVS